METDERRNIVIVGGGIIGCTTAYFLTRHPKFNPALHRITLLEASTIAAGASGKAGGLLALWAYPAELVPLSYRLHAELAAEHGGAERWGYRSRIGCGSITATVTDSDLKAQQARLAALAAAATDGDGSTHGDADGVGPARTNGTGDEQDDKDKAWEKLPKQDDAAAGLLGESALPKDLDWLDSRLVASYREMGQRGETETSQVHPYQFTTAMAQLAREKGVDIKLGAKVTDIVHTRDAVESVRYLERGTNETRTLAGVTDVVVTAGPWTGRLLPRAKVEGLRAHSVVLKADVSPYAVFTDIELPSGYVPKHRAEMGQKRRHRGNVDPEIYARPSGDVYACGEPDVAIPLPDTADLVRCDEAQCDDLVAYIATVSPVLATAPVAAKQACYLPRHMRFGEERGPLIGRTATPGLWVAAGHTCWGIQNGPGTGCLMAELLFDGVATSANIDKLDPRKFKV